MHNSSRLRLTVPCPGPRKRACTRARTRAEPNKTGFEPRQGVQDPAHVRRPPACSWRRRGDAAGSPTHCAEYLPSACPQPPRLRRHQSTYMFVLASPRCHSAAHAGHGMVSPSPPAARRPPPAPPLPAQALVQAGPARPAARREKKNQVLHEISRFSSPLPSPHTTNLYLQTPLPSPTHNDELVQRYGLRTSSLFFLLFLQPRKTKQKKLKTIKKLHRSGSCLTTRLDQSTTANNSSSLLSQPPPLLRASLVRRRKCLSTNCLSCSLSHLESVRRPAACLGGLLPC